MAKRPGPSVATGSLTDRSSVYSHPRLTLPAKIRFQNSSFSLTALIDSGCERDLIDQGLLTEELSTPLKATALDGGELLRITHRTKPIQLVISVGCTSRRCARRS
ncbi:hypothetical protein AMECASPLE_012816 [Ameca splendens]|uniref:Peptidase A2 domain-containing protein n=1 Tax=Ameca splendens TaxID=208324 RepID=A0ABV0YZY0_9TELE